MQHRRFWRIGQVGKFNKYLDKEANRTNSPTLKIMILAGKINSAKNGQAVQKG